MKISILFFGALLFSIVSGCSTGGGKRIFSQSSRRIEETKLPNGLILIFMEDASLPRIGFSLLLKAGSAQDPAGKEGLTNMVASLIDEGTSEKSSPEVAEAFAQLGTQFSASVSVDSTILSTSGLTPGRERLLEIYSDVIFHPAFLQKELDRKKSEVTDQLKKVQDSASDLADVLAQLEVYKGTNYSTIPAGTSKSIESFSRTDLLRHYFSYYRPNNAALAVYGQLDDAFKKRVKEVFSSWQSEAIPKGSNEKVLNGNSTQTKYIFFEKPDSQQAQVRMTFRSLPRNHPDYLKLRVANVILGGSFASRLNQKVRDDMGLTYSISSALDARRERGHFVISTFTRHEKLADTVQAAQKTFEDFAEKGATEEELESAKAYLIGQFPAALETVDLWAHNLLLLRLYGVPDSYLHDFAKNVSRISLRDINEVIQKHFKARPFDILIVADPSKVSGSLRRFPDLNRRRVPNF